MTLDISVGNLLVVAGKGYPIHSCSNWETDRMNSMGLRRMARTSCGIEQVIDMATSQDGFDTATSYKCTPLDPLSPELRATIVLQTPAVLLQTFITDGAGFVHLIVEDLKV